MNLKKVICICTAAATIASLGTCASVMAADGKDYKIAVVPKMTNIAWFQRMEDGVNEYNDKTERMFSMAAQQKVRTRLHM